MKKATRDWLETLPQPYRAMALKNADKQDLENEYESASDALQEAFCWNKAPEGVQFWDQVWKWTFYNEAIPSLPPIPPE